MSKWEDPEKCGWNEAALRAALEHAERALAEYKAEHERCTEISDKAIEELHTRLAEAERRLLTEQREHATTDACRSAIEANRDTLKILLTAAEQRGRQLEDVLRSLNLMCVRGWNAQDMHDVIDTALRAK